MKSCNKTFLLSSIHRQFLIKRLSLKFIINYYYFGTNIRFSGTLSISHNYLICDIGDKEAGKKGRQSLMSQSFFFIFFIYGLSCNGQSF